MKTKTCISSDVVYADAIMKLSDRTRLLYYDLNLFADGEGFFGNVKMVLNISGSKPKHFQELIDIGYIIDFGTDVYCITHWWIHNKHDKKITPTVHTYEKGLVEEDKKSRLYVLNSSVIRRNTDDNINQTKENNIIKESKLKPDSLSDDSIFSSLSVDDGITLQLECSKHNCDRNTLIKYIDESIRNRETQTTIRNPLQYILKIAKDINWKPEEASNSYIPKGVTPNVIRYSDINGSLWDYLTDEQKSLMKNQYADIYEDFQEVIALVDFLIRTRQAETFTGTAVSLFKKLADEIEEYRDNEEEEGE